MHTLYGILFVAVGTLIAWLYVLCLLVCCGFLLQVLMMTSSWIQRRAIEDGQLLKDSSEKQEDRRFSPFNSFEQRIYSLILFGFNFVKQYTTRLFKYKWVLLLGTLVLVSLIYANVYFQLRGKWVRDDVKHKDAREYFVAGQVVNSFRMILTRFVHPEHIVLSPFHYLQRRIYNQGVRYLPENDGEEGVWVDLWFVNIYAHRFYLTRDESGAGRYPYNMIRLIDLSWYSINKCMTQPFSDKKMEETHYLKRIPRMLFYYSLYKNYSVGTIYGSHRYGLSDEVLNRRIRQIEAWTDQISDAWHQSDYMKANLEKHSKIEATLDIVQLMQLRGILFNEIREGTFSCSDPFVIKYKNLVEDLVVNPQSSLRKVKNATQRRRLFNITMTTHAAEFLDDYLLHDYCNYPIHPAILEINDESYEKLYSNYYVEMDILEEMKGPPEK